jgi:hypothetical protein
MHRLAEKLYEARLARETIAADFLPLFEHMLNLAVHSARCNRPQKRQVALSPELASWHCTVTPIFAAMSGGTTARSDIERGGHSAT